MRWGRKGTTGWYALSGGNKAGCWYGAGCLPSCFLDAGGFIFPFPPVAAGSCGWFCSAVRAGATACPWLGWCCGFLPSWAAACGGNRWTSPAGLVENFLPHSQTSSSLCWLVRQKRCRIKPPLPNKPGRLPNKLDGCRIKRAQNKAFGAATAAE